MKTTTRSLIALLVLFLIAGSSCRKQDSERNDWTSFEDQNSAEFNSEQILKEVDEALNSTGLNKGNYPIRTIDTLNSPKRLTVDFGPENFLCEDGNLRRGKILVSWTGAYKQAGTLVQIGFEDFYQNDNQIQGSKQIENKGLNSDNQLVYSVNASISITSPSNQSYTWTCTRTRTWISGSSTKNRFDDVYLVSGQSSGVNRNGKNFSCRTLTDLRIDNSCTWRVVAGKLELNVEDRQTRVLDYGDGACDGTFTVNVGGKTHTVRRKK